jgi:hypothetical protein
MALFESLLKQPTSLTGRPHVRVVWFSGRPALWYGYLSGYLKWPKRGVRKLSLTGILKIGVILRSLIGGDLASVNGKTRFLAEREGPKATDCPCQAAFEGELPGWNESLALLRSGWRNDTSPLKGCCARTAR